MADRLTRRRMLGIMAAGAGAVALGGCANPAGTAGPTATPLGSGTLTPDARAELLAKAKAEGSVTWYANQDANITTPLADLFTKQTGIKVEALALGGSAMAARVLKEAEAKIYLVDTVIASSKADIIAFTDAKLLAPYRSFEHDKLPASMLDASNLSEPLYALRFVIAHNTKLLQAADAPKTWAELTDPKWKGKLAIGNPVDASAIGYVIDTLGQLFGKAYLEQLAKNQVLVSGNMAGLSTLVVAGERPVAIAITYSAVSTDKTKGNPIDAIFPSDGTIVGQASVAVMANAPHPNAARVLEDFLLSQEAQQFYAGVVGRDAVRQDVTYAPGVVPLSASGKLLSIDYAGFDKRRQQVLDDFKRLFQGG